MKILVLLFLLQSLHWETLRKSAGQTIQFTYDDVFASGENGRFVLYRKAIGSTAAPVKIAEQVSGQFTTTMPVGTTIEYRFYVVPVLRNSAGAVIATGPESNEVMVLRR